MLIEPHKNLTKQKKNRKWEEQFDCTNHVNQQRYINGAQRTNAMLDPKIFRMMEIWNDSITNKQNLII